MAIVEYCVAVCDMCPAKLPGRFDSVSGAERAAERAGWWWGGHATYDALLCTDCRLAYEPVRTGLRPRYVPREPEGSAALKRHDG